MASPPDFASIPYVGEHSEDDLAAKLQQVFNDPKLLSDLALKGAQRASERYGWAEVTRQYSNLFEELLK